MSDQQSPTEDTAAPEAVPPPGSGESGSPAARGGRPARLRLLGSALVIALAAVTVLVVIARTGGGTSSSSPASHTSTAREAWELPRLDGNGDIRLSDFHGKPTVVNFFASWCTPCRGELPGFEQLQRELTGQVDFVFVNSEEVGDGLAMAREFHLPTARIARDIGGAQDSGLHDAVAPVQAMPITAFYDRSGRLLSVHPGAIDEDSLRQRIHELYGIS